MRRLIRFMYALLLVIGTGSYSASGQETTALDIITRMDELTRGSSQQGTYEMTIIRPDWERKMSFDFWSVGTEKSFIRINEPVKERGVSFLKIDREMWQYVPRINRVIKIPPSMMLQSWMGSNFTNDDLVRESSIIEDYEHVRLEDELVEEQEVYVIESQPRPEAAVAWAKMHQWVRKSDFIPVRAVYFNERGERIRTMHFSGIKVLGGRTVPTIMELVEDKKEGQSTVLILTDATYNATIPNAIFSQQNLRKSR